MARNRFLPITGSNSFTTAGNWSTGSANVNADDAEIFAGSASIDTGLTPAITLTSFTFANTFTGTVGTAPSGSSLGSDLAINFTRADIGLPVGQPTASGGSPRLRIASTTAGIVSVYSTGSPADSSFGLEAFRWKNTANSGSRLTVLGGSVGYGTDGSAVYYLDQLDLNDGTVGVGATSTIITLTQRAGILSFRGIIAASGSLTQYGGIATILTENNIATLNVGGTMYLNGRPPTKAVSGITRTSTTATATSTAHGYSNGDVVRISGADQTEYNGVFVISNVAANTFDYTVANSPTATATTSTAFTCFRSAATDVRVRSGATLDLSRDPRPLAFKNPIQLDTGATLVLAKPTQLAVLGSDPSRPAQLNIADADIPDVIIRYGRGVAIYSTSNS